MKTWFTRLIKYTTRTKNRYVVGILPSSVDHNLSHNSTVHINSDFDWKYVCWLTSATGALLSVSSISLWHDLHKKHIHYHNFCNNLQIKITYALLITKTALNTSLQHLTDRRSCVQISRNTAVVKSAKSCNIYLTKKFWLPLNLKPSLLR